MAIAPDDLSSLGLGWQAAGPALVHGVADVVVDPDGDGGVTGDPPHHLAIDQSVMLELPGELRGSVRIVDQSGQGGMDDHEVRAGRRAGAPR